jgi:phosphoglycolate phosphatase
MTDLPRESGPWGAALFDLDGTLVDSSEGIRSALAASLDELNGRASLADRADLSLPLTNMIRNLVPEATSPHLRLLIDAFRRHYDAEFWKEAKLYAGAEECLRDLRAGGTRLFVITNKRTIPARRILNHVRLARYLEGIVGQPDSGEPLPKHELVRRCLADAGLSPVTSVIVGDSDQDASAAMFWGITFVAVTSGAGPLGDASVAEHRVEVGSLADATAIVLRRSPGGSRES